MYFITMIDKLDMYEHHNRCFGYKETYEQAERCVIDNCMDLHEYLYEYAVIEKIEPGIHSFREDEHWFKWNPETKKYDPINKPDVFSTLVNFAMG